jgi:general secretion pathway protein K
MSRVRCFWRRLRQPVGPRRRRQAGIALIVVTVTLAVLGAVVGDFSFNARVDLEAAANSRDTLRAEYLARSGIQLSRLLIKVQQSVIDRNRQFIGDLQISQFAPFLVKAFGGAADERAGLASLLGFDASQLKGLGAGKGATFDVTMASDDGRININCGGGLNPNQQQAQALGNLLAQLFWPPRYDNPPWRIFGWPDADGQVAQREETVRAIIDWTDVDEQQFVLLPPQTGNAPTPTPSSAGAESYNYDNSRDPYKARNHYFDTLEELNLVRGVGDNFWSSFGEMFTVYGGCKVNIGAVPSEKWPILAAIIRYAAKDPTNPVLIDDVKVAALAQQILGLMQMTGGMLVKDIDTFVKAINDPTSLIPQIPGSPTQSPGGQGLLPGVQLDAGRAKQVMTMGPRRIYRLDSVGTIQRTREKKIEVHIRAIWDAEHVNQMVIPVDPNDAKGTWVYWRQD